jgi:GAF domain-containing protein
METRANDLTETNEIKALMEELFNSDFPYKEQKELINHILSIKTNNSLKEISDLVYEEARRLTNSKFCYVAYVDPENKDSIGISFTHMTGECDMYEEMGEARFKVQKDGTYGGLLGYSLDTGKSFYVHDIASHPAAHGLPQGHVPVEQFLSVPVIYKDKILGQIVLGNPEVDYNDDHLKIADKIADFYAIILDKYL